MHRCERVSLALPRLLDFSQIGDRAKQQLRREIAHGSTLPVGRHIFHRGLAVHAREEEARKQSRRAAFCVGWGLPSDTCQVRATQSIKAFEISAAPLGSPQTLEKHVIEAECQVESRVAVPCALGVQEHWTTRPTENVFWTDIAVHQSQLSRSGDAYEFFQRCGEVGMCACSGIQVGFEANGKENVIGGELLCNGSWPAV